MKPLHVTILALIALGAALALWLNDGAAPAPTRTEQKLFPELASNLDSATQLTVSDAKGGKVTLERKDAGWRVIEQAKYYANSRTVGELLVALSDAAVLEEKTANPEFYERLGLREVSDSASNAVLVSLASPAQTFEVLLGNTSARFDGSTFVRKPGSEPSYLVSKKLQASTDSYDWLDRQVLDIASDEVQSVKITHGDDTLEILRDSVDSDFDLFDRQEEQALNTTAVKALSRGLAGLSFEEVRKGAAFAVNDYQRKSLAYALFDGTQVLATVFYKEPEASEDSVDDSTDNEDQSSGPPAQPEYWLNVGVRFDEQAAQQFAPQPTATVNGEEPKTLILTPADLADRRARAEQINQKTRMWMYKITSARFDSFNQTVDSLTDAP